MNNRKIELLNSIIREYIALAEPISSNLVVKNYDLKVSPATIRNDMLELEKDGYIYQPHISAGRIPTEKGYKFYIKNFLKREKISQILKRRLEEIYTDESENWQVKIKNIVKNVAMESKEAMIVAFEDVSIYYTGITNLFSQPEFHEHISVCNLSAIIDQMDEVIYKCYNSKKISNNINILIGAENPFGQFCSAIITKLPENKNNILMCMLGPMRMDYGKNVALIEYLRELITG